MKVSRFDRGALRALFSSPRRVTVEVDRGTEARIRAFVDRLNAEYERVGWEDREDADDDESFAITVAGLVEGGLRASEAEHGLVGYIDGRVMTQEESEECQRAIEARRAEMESEPQVNVKIWLTLAQRTGDEVDFYAARRELKRREKHEDDR